MEKPRDERILFLFRHGETDWNREGRLQGHTDTPLNANGLAQAEALADSLLPHRLDAVVSSDLTRARTTAQIVADVLRVPLFIEPGLRETDVGALINAGSGTGGGSGPELFRVADLHMMRIYVQVPQELSAGIKAGLSAELHLPQYPDKTFKAMVATTSSAINANARTLLVELQADNPKSELQPGAYAQVDFELPADSDVVRIPTSALVFRKHGMEVATIGPDQKITLKPIELGRNLGVEVEVLKGLTISDRLVNSPPDSLATGDSVRITGEFARATGGAQTSDATAQETTSSRADSKVHRGEQISEPTDQVKKSPATGFAKEPAGKSGVSGPPVATLATVPL